jgi:hypothetical protein
MKKLVSLLLILSTLTLLFVSCKKDDTVIRVGYMAGPTGMGMAKLIGDNDTEKYDFKKYADTAVAKADLTAGNIDIICLPTNEAAMYYNNVDKNLRVLATVLHALYEYFNRIPNHVTLRMHSILGQHNPFDFLVAKFHVDVLVVDFANDTFH